MYQSVWVANREMLGVGEYSLLPLRKDGEILALIDCIWEEYLFLKISPYHCLLLSLIGYSVPFSGKIHQELGSKMENQNLNQLLSSIFCLLHQELRPGEFNYSFEEHFFVSKGRS